MKCLWVMAWLSGAALGACSSGCSADNGELFGEVLVLQSPDSVQPSAGSDPPGQGPPLPDRPPAPGSPEGMSGSLPLDEEVPVTVRGDPPGDAGVPRDPDPEGPAIVAVAPADGAVAVPSDTQLVIRFSEPMDQQSTEAAYQSEQLPSSSVSFAWNEDLTELTITPGAPLEYSRASTPELAQARHINYFFSASARAASGVSLARPYEFSFSLLREVAFSVSAVLDREATGNYRSNDSYGGGACAEDEVNMCVGDSRVGGSSEQYKGFISFDLAPLPEATSIVQLRAALALEMTDVSGNPFAGLGSLLVEHVRFDAIGLAAFEAEPLGAAGTIASEGGTGTLLGADVSTAVAALWAQGADAGTARAQFRLSFERATDADNTSDVIISSVATQRLDVSYLIP